MYSKISSLRKYFHSYSKKTVLSCIFLVLYYSYAPSVMDSDLGNRNANPNVIKTTRRQQFCKFTCFMINWFISIFRSSLSTWVVDYAPFLLILLLTLII